MACNCWSNCFRRLFSNSSVSPSIMSRSPSPAPDSPPRQRSPGHDEGTPVDEPDDAGTQTAEQPLIQDDHRARQVEQDRTGKPREHSIENQRGGGGGGIRYIGNCLSSFVRSFSQGPPLDYENMSLEKKRQYYRCEDKYITLDKIPTWEEQSGCSSDRFPLASKLSLWRGDITRLEIDAIVNAANSSLLGGGGVDGAIHRAAGSQLLNECRGLNGCDAGDAKLTRGYALPAKYILHTVGPMNRNQHTLTSCYNSCIRLVEQHQLRSVAFCCVSTGIYGYPNEAAAHVAVRTVREWLADNYDKVDRIIFCVFLDIDYNIYRRLLHEYFTQETEDETDDANLEAGKRKTDDPAGKGESDERETDDSATKSESDDTDQVTKEKTEDINEKPPVLQRSITEPAPRSSTLEKTTESLEQDKCTGQEVQGVTEILEVEMEETEDCNENTDSPSHGRKRPKTTD